MKVGIVGSGRIGGNIGTQIARAGNEVMFSFSRQARKLEDLAGSVAGATAGAPRDAVEFADAVVLSVPWDAVGEALLRAGSLDGKVVVDTTNQFGARGVETLPDGLSAAEVNERRMPGAKLAKAFNTLTAGYQRDVAEGKVEGEIAMFYATEDEDAAEVCAGLISTCGFQPVRIGGWDEVSLIEAPRRDGAVYGEAYTADDARTIAAAASHDRSLATRLARELKRP